ncbi:MAG: hypothetical protein U5J82_05485 [Desulfobacterales bacterium]|nr:hypothetical protein [Desulfobacterales bacterium]
MRWRCILKVVEHPGVLHRADHAGPPDRVAHLLRGREHRTPIIVYDRRSPSLVGALMHLASVGPKAEVISQREGMAIVAVGWTAVGDLRGLALLLRSAISAPS